jgi:hypothetical protein
MSKTKVLIFINPSARSTIILTKHIGKFIDQINQHLFLDIRPVNSKNVAAIAKMGITRTPTLIHGGRQYVSLEKIISLLTPPRAARETGSLDATDPDELTHKYMDSVVYAKDDGMEETEAGVFDQEIRRKMMQFQKRRPAMQGVSEDKMIKGGRKIKAIKHTAHDFATDDDFRQAAKISDTDKTPSRFAESDRSEYILEDYMNEEADRSGRVKNNKPIRWPT